MAFPNCKLIIFHGGAGTLEAALGAGISIIILSVFGDQPMWGKIIHKKGIGIHIKFKHLTTQKLIAAIDQVKKSKCLSIEQIINNENSIALTIEMI